MLLRDANVTDDRFNAFKGALTASHTSPSTNQLDESGIVNSELTVIQVSQEPAQIQGPGTVVRNTSARTATITNSKSRDVVVGHVRRTRRIIKTIKGMSKRVNFGSVSVQ